MEIFSLLSCGKQTTALKFYSANSESKGDDSPHGIKLIYTVVERNDWGLEKPLQDSWALTSYYVNDIALTEIN